MHCCRFVWTVVVQHYVRMHVQRAFSGNLAEGDHPDDRIESLYTQSGLHDITERRSRLQT
jgi:hypothetical protein